MLKSSKSSDRRYTPAEITRPFFDVDPKIFGVDVCTDHNAPELYGVNNLFEDETDGLTRDWTGFAWMNPPYSNITPWVNKLSRHSGGGIALLPNNTDTSWFHDIVYVRASIIGFIRGRINYIQYDVDKNTHYIKKGNPWGSIFVGFTSRSVDLIHQHPRVGSCWIP